MYRFQVDGISCSKCVATITNAIQKLDQHAQVDVGIENQEVDVETSLPPHVVERAIVDAGYPVREMVY